MNVFESGARKVIPATLIYAVCGDRVLMVHRNADGRPGDSHAGKWNGLGGKCELDESPLDGARREFREECGLDLPEESYRALGTLTFPNFKPRKAEDWVVFVFRVELPPTLASLKLSCPEGDLHWVKLADLSTLNLWPGDHYFLPYVERGEPFLGTIWYQGGELVRHWMVGLGLKDKSN